MPNLSWLARFQMSKEPKDLGLKVGSKDEQFWKAVKDKAVEDNLNASRQTELNLELIKYCNKRILEEKAKFK